MIYTPKKIYVNYLEDYFTPAIEEKLPYYEEYVHSDAIKEWADNYKKHIDEEQLLDDTTKSVAKSVLDDLIDKIKSL